MLCTKEDMEQLVLTTCQRIHGCLVHSGISEEVVPNAETDEAMLGHLHARNIWLHMCYYLSVWKAGHMLTAWHMLSSMEYQSERKESQNRRKRWRRKNMKVKENPYDFGYVVNSLSMRGIYLSSLTPSTYSFSGYIEDAQLVAWGWKDLDHARCLEPHLLHRGCMVSIDWMNVWEAV